MKKRNEKKKKKKETTSTNQSPGAIPIPGHLTPSPRSETFSCQGSTNAFASAHSQSRPLPAVVCKLVFVLVVPLCSPSSVIPITLPAASAVLSPLRLLHTLHRDLAIAQLHNGVLVVPCGFLPNARHLIQLACSPPRPVLLPRAKSITLLHRSNPVASGFTKGTLACRSLWTTQPESSHQANLGPPLASR